ncbi:hypothetical protein [Fulvivirga sedimenti]|uniref:DUF7832 domain-containing protein n=1 Tax=Fulvivirga sedimenti TaxID=2879465 RepID=A0A9X1KUA5_9BACT|nr:hypothetical protein [Fulvivirga sedimenti]MCA6073278.1 hypothetical protein [Fulvivirga sedimenti]
MSLDKRADIQKTIYDNAKSHFLGNFPENLPIEQAYVHIGIYLGWIIDNELYSEYFEEEAEVQILRFKRREISCTILSELWDGYLGYELFNKQGNMFSYYYYGGGLYRRDYDLVLVKELPSIYHVKDSWENYESMSNRIDVRFSDWKKMIS